MLVIKFLGECENWLGPSTSVDAKMDYLII